ncbi:MAG: hypothetical protein P1V35_13555, partial [Planctomycetota bacterium]|nr:hypothetical protein [Planctomycetota bacterium]
MALGTFQVRMYFIQWKTRVGLMVETNLMEVGLGCVTRATSGCASRLKLPAMLVDMAVSTAPPQGG